MSIQIDFYFIIFIYQKKQNYESIKKNQNHNAAHSYCPIK